MADQELLEMTIKHLAHRRGVEDARLEVFKTMLEDLHSGQRKCLSLRQRKWVNDVLDEFEPRAENLVSRGLVPRGRPVETPEVLKVLPKRPPTRPKPITHVAIKFRGETYSLPEPNRHHHVIKLIADTLKITRIDKHEEGFLDEAGLFLDRKQALARALHTNQVKNPNDIRAGQLFSEDLW